MTRDDATDGLRDRLAVLSPAKRALLERALLERTRQSPASASHIPRRSDHGPAPLTCAQQGIWFLEQWEPGSGLFGAREALRLAGPLDVALFRRALGAVVHRHDILRTTFAEVGGQPVQMVVPHSTVPVPVVDLSALPAAERAVALQDLRRAEARCHFDLIRGPMLRAVLLRTGDAEHVLLLSLHHIVADGWSYSVLIRELSAHYTAFCQGRPPQVADLPLQFADYAAWQRQRLHSGELQAQLDWWKSRLAGAPPVLKLPAGGPRPAAPSHRSGIADMTVSPAVAGALRALSRRAGVTLL